MVTNKSPHLLFYCQSMSAENPSQYHSSVAPGTVRTSHGLDGNVVPRN